jgi:hypothetical protein
MKMRAGQRQGHQDAEHHRLICPRRIGEGQQAQDADRQDVYAGPVRDDDRHRVERDPDHDDQQRRSDDRRLHRRQGDLQEGPPDAGTR